MYRLCFLLLLLLPARHLAAQTPVLEITGADEALTTNIRAHVRLPDLPCEASPENLRRFLPTIGRNVVRAGRALGYYHLQHASDFTAGDDCWRLGIEVEPGVPIVMGTVNIVIEGDSGPFTATVLEPPLASGDRLDQSRYEAIKTELSSLAVENGFFGARFDRSELQLDLVRNRADVDIRFDPGERYLVDEVRIPDLDGLDADFIARYSSLAAGSPYSSEEILQLRNSLSNSQYFSSVSVTPVIEEARDGRIPVDVSLQLRPQQAYSVGAGVTTDTGPRVRLDHENRYLTRDGHSIQSQLGLSPVRQNLDLQYLIPLSEPASEILSLSAGFLGEDTDSFEDETTMLSANYGFVNRFNWRQNYFVNFQHDRFNISDNTSTSDLLITGVSLNRTRADDLLLPTRGWRLFGEVKGASNALLSSDSFLQLNLAGKYVQGLGPGRALLKFEAGFSEVDAVEHLPASIRYFSGGDQSVRGYKYQSLGPEDEAGEVIGGKHQLSFGVEYDFPIAAQWRLALFADRGNSFNDFSEMDLKSGAGIGVRWLSPIGPIRVDLASALDDDHSLRLHVTMGPDL